MHCYATLRRWRSAGFSAGAAPEQRPTHWPPGRLGGRAAGDGGEQALARAAERPSDQTSWPPGRHVSAPLGRQDVWPPRSLTARASACSPHRPLPGSPFSDHPAWRPAAYPQAHPRTRMLTRPPCHTLFFLTAPRSARRLAWRPPAGPLPASRSAGHPRSRRSAAGLPARSHARACPRQAGRPPGRPPASSPGILAARTPAYLRPCLRAYVRTCPKRMDEWAHGAVRARTCGHTCGRAAGRRRGRAIGRAAGLARACASMRPYGGTAAPRMAGRCSHGAGQRGGWGGKGADQPTGRSGGRLGRKMAIW